MDTPVLADMDISDKGIDPRIYEIGYHVLSTFSDEQVEAVTAELRAKIAEAKGTMIAEGAPVMTKLAYTMSTQTAGGKKNNFDRAHFGWMKFEMMPDAAHAFKAFIGVHKSLLRSMLFTTVREDTRAAARAVLKDIRRTDTIETPRREEKSVEVSEAQLDKALEEIVTE
jgi:ribosomal protein S6